MLPPPGSQSETLAISRPPQLAAASHDTGETSTAPFVFINTTDPRRQNDQTSRKLIRTHVMRNLQRNENAVAERASKAEGEVAGQLGKFRLSSQGLHDTRPSRRNRRTLPVRPKDHEADDKKEDESISTNENVDAPGVTGPVTRVTANDKRKRVWPSQPMGLGRRQNEQHPWNHDGSADPPAVLHGNAGTLTLSSHAGRGFTRASFAPQLVAGPGAALDPFDAFPYIAGERSYLQMDRFRTSYMDCWCPVNPQSAWLFHAFTDVTLFNATMFHFTSYYRREDTIDILNYKGEAIRQINRRLADPNEAISDGVIAAVTCMASVEINFGTIDATKMHLDGLKRMVSMRGGMENLGYEGLLERLILWVDSCHATVCGLEFEFPQIAMGEDRLLPKVFSPEHGPLVPAARPPSLSLFTLDPELSGLFLDMRRLCVGFDTIGRRDTIADRTRMYLSDRLFALHRRLFFMAGMNRPVDRHKEAHQAVNDTACLGGLIFSISLLRGVNLAASMFNNTMDRLYAEMSQFQDMTMDWAGTPDLLLWLLWLGVAVGSGRPQRPWFVQKLTEACQAFHIRSWAELKRVLEGVLWLELTAVDVNVWYEVVDTVLKGDEVWDEILAAMAEHG